jgi:uncharacterized RDD family membrane protein YckC
MSSEPIAPGGLPLANPGMRIVARLIDIVIGMVVSLILAVIVGASTGFGNVGGSLDGSWFFYIILSLGFGFVYEAVLTKLYGGTPGKLILGFRVVDGTSGAAVSWQAAILRWAVPGAFGIVPFIGGLAAFVVQIVSLVFLFTDTMHRTVSDRVATTLVVNTKAGVAAG